MENIQLGSRSLQYLVNCWDEQQLTPGLPIIRVGDILKVNLIVQEANKSRFQAIEATVIAKTSSGSNKIVNLRKVVQGIGVERLIPIHSSMVATLQVIRHSKVRKAKLYYLRSSFGKRSRLQQLFIKDSV
uniref:Ribosomal protein L19 n=1 Tax=Chara vulgaris TaxID=55564 RepID=Q1ACJ4_CHAVU|nr:ribosomal protein L19 [Chara vulgaris]ABA61947.1 ribosomal protein L19 [Chara vulgaris]WAP91324.1 ribosomal protein L19 [Chara vulgaris]